MLKLRTSRSLSRFVLSVMTYMFHRWPRSSCCSINLVLFSSFTSVWIWLILTCKYQWLWCLSYISQLIWYSRACISYHNFLDFLDRGLLLTRKLLNQEFKMVKLKSSLRKFYGRHHELVDRYGITVSQMISDMFITL